MFSLFEAMSAIEMMDPKMDSGMACNRVSRKVVNLQDSVASGLVKVTDFKIDELIGIVDDSTACLMSWLDGHSLAQTVFTNLYLHDPLIIVDKALKAFCLLHLKMVEAFREFIVRAEVFEEEDFQSGLFNFRLDYDISESKICSMVRDVEEDLIKKIKVLKRQVSSTPDCDTSLDIESIEKEISLLQGLHARLKVHRCLLSALSCIGKETEIPRRKDPSSNHHGKNMTNGNNSAVDTFAIDCAKHLDSCRDSLASWKQTIDLGIKPANVTESQGKQQTGYASPADYPVIPGFEPLINQRLLPPTFPRYTKLRNRSEAVDEIESLVRRLKHVIKVREVTSFNEALLFFDYFSRIEEGSTCVLSRSVLQLAYVPQTATISSREQFLEILKEAARDFIRPPSLQITLNNANNKTQSTCKIKQAVDAFMTQSLRPMMSLLQIQGHNRARQREKLAMLLEEFSAFQTESETVDSFLNSCMASMNSNMDVSQTTPSSHLGFFASWVLYHEIRVMLQFTFSGFELELYSPHEYPYLYWYIYEFLYGWLISTLTRASNTTVEQKTIAEWNRKATATGKNAKKLNKINKKKLLKDPKPHHRELQIHQAMQQLSGGLFKTTMAFKFEERLKEPRLASGSSSKESIVAAEKLRFEHRFLPFWSIVSPPFVSYEQYREMLQHTYLTTTPQILYLAASLCFDEARKILEAIPDPDKEVRNSDIGQLIY